MYTDSGTDQPGVLSGARQRLADTRLLSFLPLVVLVAYWTRIEVVLFVVSFMFPLLVALQELTRARRPRSSTPSDQMASDALTGLTMRQQAVEGLQHFLDTERTTGRVTAVLLIDLDQFSKINERYGIDGGDAVLVSVANRIRDAMRDHDIVARIDGDCFAAILSPVKRADFESAVAVAERISAAIAEPICHDRNTIYVTCSVGICLMGRAPEGTAISMLQAAETALADARRGDGAAIRSFSPKMRRETRKLTALSTELEAALENGQIRPWFQPQICTDTGAVIGFEALARWQHPDDGVMLPGSFLKAVADAGRSERLSEVVLYHALSALKSWDKAGLNVPTVAVNFSTDELRNPKLCEKIKWEVDRFDLEPRRVAIEILETVMSAPDEDGIARNIQSLSGLGFGIDLDDFGTGHASIANIRRFGVSRIKIDRSFIANVDQDRAQQQMIAAIVRMADSLGVDALAEGVEKIGEQAMLAQLGCRYIQGYGLARPMPFEDTIAWLHKHNEKLPDSVDLGRRAG